MTPLPAAALPTAAIADACVRLGLPLRAAPVTVVPLIPDAPFHGPARPITHLDGVAVTCADTVSADDDGVLFVATDRYEEVCDIAERFVATEGEQSERMRRGESLRSQLHFADYLARQAVDPSLTLRRHLAERGGAIEV